MARLATSCVRAAGIHGGLRICITIVTAPGYRSLVTEIFPDDDPYLDQDTVFGVRDDLVMRYVEKPASEFPDGMEISGKVEEPFLCVEFDVTLKRED